jgi:hypothetical protein
MTALDLFIHTRSFVTLRLIRPDKRAPKETPYGFSALSLLLPLSFMNRTPTGI